jgi:catechol 2,3-dioxygenase-like lactoylglutathione lyase family enzyme
VFDGIDVVTLPAVDIEPLLDLYVDLLGFEDLGAEPVGDTWQVVWGLPSSPVRARLLGKPGSAGGWIRLVEVPSLPRPGLTTRADRIGPLALDFYLRDPERVERRLEEGGWQFLTEAVRYPLPGTDVEVRERMLVQPVSGLVHATVLHRPRQTRCILDQAPEHDTSEVVACVFVTDDFTGACAFAEDVLGGHRYFDGRFDGPAVERMLDLGPGEGFRAALFRGPASRNARLEFAERRAPDSETPSSETWPTVVAGCAVDDLDALAGRLAGGTHGESTGLLTVETAKGTSRRLGLRSSYGAAFEFWQRATS